MNTCLNQFWSPLKPDLITYISGKIVVAQVLFSGKGITSNMAPKEAVAQIKNLIISCTAKGSQDHNSLLEAYRKFDKYLTEENIQRPVVVLADGHSSRFDYKVLYFLRENLIYLFITPADTTGVTQLLDQDPNSSLHREYDAEKKKLFPSFQTINREGFMTILGNIWDKWATSESIIKAARRVGTQCK